MADWSKLPFDVLYEIVTRFETIEDLVYFSVVCRFWNHFTRTSKEKFIVKTTPWLLLSEDTENNPQCLRKVFNPFNDKFYQLKLPETFGCRCWGSAYGWLVTYTESLDLQLFNPLTKVTMSLPPITSMPYLCKGNFLNPEPWTLLKMRNSFIKKAFVLKVGVDDLVVFLSYYFTGRKLAFARPGDQPWTSIDHPGHTREYEDNLRGKLDYCVGEVICRGAQILVLYCDGSLMYLNNSDLSDPEKLVAKDHLPTPYMTLTDSRNLGIMLREYIPTPLGILDGLDNFQYGLYMFESFGDLFMVVRDRCCIEEVEGAKDHEYGTFGFKVYRLDFDNKEWSEVHHLNDTVLFVGCGSSLSIPAIRALNSQSNTIYFADDQDDNHRGQLCWGYDMGVFNLKDRLTIEEIYGDYYADSKVQSALWFTPRWCLKRDTVILTLLRWSIPYLHNSFAWVGNDLNRGNLKLPLTTGLKRGNLRARH